MIRQQFSLSKNSLKDLLSLSTKVKQQKIMQPMIINAIYNKISLILCENNVNI